MIAVTSNAEEYRDALIAEMARFQLSAQETVRTEARLLGERVIKFTPPQSQAQGKQRVDADIRKVIFGMEEMTPADELEPVVAGDPSIVKAFVKDHTVYGASRDQYLPNASLEVIQAAHEAARSKDGRVHGKGPQDKSMGDWVLIRKLIVPADLLNQYIRSVQARVGRGKGGWAKGVLQLGGTLAQWIAGHADTGTFQDQTKDLEPSATFENQSEWAGRHDEDRAMANAIQARTRDIFKKIKSAKRVTA